ncbi:MAG: CHAD domain-containing protein, partial [Proteobacteria bacterium]|nr:CHAD domain-containing protein [Pseudomonadota bacterium]
MTRLKPENRTDEQVKMLFLDLIMEMERHESALLKKHSEKKLHQYRIAVRRTRSLLGQSKFVLPANRLNRFRKEFTWLGEITSGPRDLDVYLIRMEKLQSEHASQTEHIQTFMDYINSKRDEQIKRLYDSLHGSRYRKLKQDWIEFLNSPNPGTSSLLYAKRPLRE